MSRIPVTAVLLLITSSACRERTAAQPEMPAEKTGDGMMMGRGSMMGGGSMMGDAGMMGGGSMMSGDGMMEGMGPEMMGDMRVIRRLLANHDRIQRNVEDIPNGVRTVTTSEDPEIASFIRKHVWQMKDRMEQGEPIRRMDPVFREIFEHREKIELQIEEIPGGVRVTETSQDPDVVKLIRQHAHRAVSEFVRDGMRRAMQPTPLPEGYPAER